MKIYFQNFLVVRTNIHNFNLYLFFLETMKLNEIVLSSACPISKNNSVMFISRPIKRRTWDILDVCRSAQLTHYLLPHLSVESGTGNVALLCNSINNLKQPNNLIILILPGNGACSAGYSNLSCPVN